MLAAGGDMAGTKEDGEQRDQGAEARLDDFSRAKLCFSYRVLRDVDDVLLAEGSTQNVFTDTNGRIVRLPQLYYDRIDAVRQAEDGGVA